MQSAKFLVAGLLLLAITSSTLASKKPIISMEFCRHGDRAPLGYVFDNAALNNYTVAFGQLTPNGMRQHFLIGQQLRQVFVEELKFLGPTFSNQDVYIRSSDVNRTLESANSQLLGLFPAGTGPQIHNLQSQDIAIPPLKLTDNGSRFKADAGLSAIMGGISPMPINTIPFADDLLLAAWGGACPKYTVNYNNSIKAASTAEYYNAHVKKVIDNLNSLLGLEMNVLTANDIWTTFGQLTCGYYNGNPLPEGISVDYLFNEVIPPVAHLLYYEYSYGNYENSLLAASEMLAEIKKRITTVINGQTSPKFMLYSAHDLTLASLITVFKMKESFPTFASTIFFDLYKKDNADFLADDLSNYYVQITFNSEPMLIPGCDDIECDLPKFFTLLDSLIIPDIVEACKVDDPTVDLTIPYDF